MSKNFLHKSSLKANIIANFAGNGWSALVGLLFVPLYLKYIGAEGYGLVGVFASLQVVLSLLDSGLTTTLNKEIARLAVLKDTGQKIRNIVKTLGTAYWFVALLAGIIAAVLSPFIAAYWVRPQELSRETITWAFLFLSGSVIFQFPIGFYGGGLLGLQKQVLLNVIKIVFVTVKHIGALLLLLYVSKSVVLFFAWNMVAAMIQAITLMYLLWRHLPAGQKKAVFEWQELNNVKRFASGMMGISLTAILMTQADKIILSKILSLEQFGYYTVGCTLGLVINQVIVPLTQSYFPKFSNLISLGKTDELKKLYHHASQLLAVLALPLTFILVFFSKELIYIWTQNETTASQTWKVAAIYGLGTGLNGLINIPYILMLSHNWTKLSFYQNIGFLLLMMPLTFFLAKQYGASGGALSWAIVNTLYFLVTPHFVHQKLLKGEAGKWYWNDSLKPMFASLAVIFLFWYFADLKQLGQILQLLILGTAGLLSLTAALFFADQLNKNIFAAVIKS